MSRLYPARERLREPYLYVINAKPTSRQTHLGLTIQSHIHYAEFFRHAWFMDSTAVTGMAAALGSLVGASASIAATWITQRHQTFRAKAEWRLHERQSLYNDFITEASRLTVDARVHSLEHPEQLAALYGVLNRIRLISSDEILENAEACCRQIVDLYWRPNMTLQQFRAAYESDELDSLKEFSLACRKELLALSSAA